MVRNHEVRGSIPLFSTKFHLYEHLRLRVEVFVFAILLGYCQVGQYDYNIRVEKGKE